MNKISGFAVLQSAMLAVFTLSGCTSSTGKTALAGSTAKTGLPKINMEAWLYNADDNVYYQTGISYAETPADANYESMGIFVPGAYFDAQDNGDGTYSVQVKADGKAGPYTAKNAPAVILVETPGYSACTPPSGYVSSVKDFTDEGIIYIYPGCRGRNHGAPTGVTDLKAAIRYWRYNADILPGSSERIFSFGMSGGGAQSALLGATGNSALYEPYLEAIGAVKGVSDAVTGSMCWCPITNLDSANEAYEWNMGASRSNLDSQSQQISDALAESFAAYINSIGLKSEDGESLSLQESAEGLWQAGSYYDYTKAFIENSLNNFLADTSFPYDASKAQSGGFGGMMGGGNGPRGGRGGMPQGGMDYAQMDDIRRTNTASSGLELNGKYETKEDYINALNANGVWVLYDEETGKAKITSIADFAKNVKTATKSVGAFDDLNARQGENTLFAYGDGNGAHFDKYLAEIVKGTQYEEAFAADLARTDSLGKNVAYRMNAYNPLYYLNKHFDGYRTSDVAPFWRIRSGIFQGDTAVSTEMNLALALKNYGIKNVDIEAVWGQKHVKAERTGESTSNFISWVHECMMK